MTALQDCNFNGSASGGPEVVPAAGVGPAGEIEASQDFDAVVIGGGVAGLSACIFLCRAGLRVLCIEPEKFPHDRVGESLDWSSPQLLKDLGVPGDELIDSRIATYKRNIKIEGTGRPAWTAQPKEWFRRRPISFEVVTLHVDRVEMDRRIFEVAERLGTGFLWSRVSKIETHEGRVIAIRTGDNKRFTARWFIDASGQARLFARAFNIPKVEYGKPKVCVWARFKTAIHNEGTTFYVDPDPGEYLAWIWEIPIRPLVSSIGCVMPADRMKNLHSAGQDVKAIFTAEIAKHTRLARLAAAEPNFEIYTCSYRTYVHERVCGDNWFMVGESASLPDPLTSNGVTAAIRHSKEACAFITETERRHGGKESQSPIITPARTRWVYEKNVRGMGHVFNHSIETAIYATELRKGLGVRSAQKVYTAFSYTINALYSRWQPRTPFRSKLFGWLLSGVWTWIEWWALVGSATMKFRPLGKKHLQA
ncbi:MAG TPA: NAD(P)/FAD-dependent oxidoreductase [Blastocatellia bacterium]